MGQFGLFKNLDDPAASSLALHLPCRQFSSIYLAQQRLTSKSDEARDLAKLPGRLLLLTHALHLLEQHPNMRLRKHPTWVIAQVCTTQSLRHGVAHYVMFMAVLLWWRHVAAEQTAVRTGSGVCSQS